MKIDFKTLPMMQLRNSPGEILDRVAKDGDVYIVERNGRPKGCLVPVSFLLPDISPERITQELSRLVEMQADYRLTILESKELEISCNEITLGQKTVVSIVLPHGYPDSAPRIYARPLEGDAPHRWSDGSLSIFGLTANWNAKTHDVGHSLTLARGWLKQYAKWRKSGTWPDLRGA